MKYYIIAGEASGDLHGSNLMKGLYSEDSDAEIRFWGGDLMNAVHLACARAASPGGTATGESDVPHRGCRGVDGSPLPYSGGLGSARAASPGGTATGESDIPHRGCRGVDGSPLPYSGGLVCHYKEGAIMGFWEVFKKAGKLLGNVRRCKADILAWNPDVVILIDYPGFNFKIAEFAHKHGFRTFYYIAPKVWASREGRIRKLKKYVDKLFIVFPFEIPYFKAKGVDAVYLGNPLVDSIADSRAMNESRQDFLKRNSLDDKPYIALLAGSRKGEISSMMPVLTEFAARLKSVPQYKDYQFIIAGAPARTMDDYKPYMDKCDDIVRNDIRIVFGETQSVIRHAEAAVVNSGTASLETVLLGTPQVVGYISSRLTYLIARRIVKIKYISLGNLIVDKPVFRELIQDDCSAEKLLEEVRALIENKEYRSRMLDGYAEIRDALGNKGASKAVASAMIADLRRQG